jgi:hypothetical protein
MSEKPENKIPDLPSNSYKSKQQKIDDVPKKTVEKVIKGKVTQKKKPLGKRFTETFFGGSLVGTWRYLWQDVLVPALQNLFIDAVRGGTERLVFGERVTGRYRPPEPGRPIINYGQHYNASSVYKGYPTEPVTQPRRSGRSFENPIFVPQDYTENGVLKHQTLDDAKHDALNVLSSMADYLGRYQQVTIGDFNDFVGETGEFTDIKWGWLNLATANVTRVREGWVLNLPPPAYLE